MTPFLLDDKADNLVYIGLGEVCARIGHYVRVIYRLACKWIFLSFFHFSGHRELQIEDEATEVIRFGHSIFYISSDGKLFVI